VLIVREQDINYTGNEDYALIIILNMNFLLKYSKGKPKIKNLFDKLVKLIGFQEIRLIFGFSFSNLMNACELNRF
jgi:hypothetical protein